ncbi:hypothetical protein [Nocardia sp. NPDC050435]|uniref:hypothetical protein n=1 Tax=Nocardia sp. NPDC050435 TaxID=3155040 RepID=UPI0033F990E7
MTTPESRRNTWPQRQVRMDDQTMKKVRDKLNNDGERWQGVVETMVRDWLAGHYDLTARRAALKEAGILPD